MAVETIFTPQQVAYHEGQERRRKIMLNLLHTEPLRSRLLAYANRHGIKGGEGDENFVLMEAFGRVCAAKVLRELDCPFRNAGLTDTLDGTFQSGGTQQAIEIKVRNMVLRLFNEKWDWQIDASKDAELNRMNGWLLTVWIDCEKPDYVDWGLWYVPDASRTDSYKYAPASQAVAAAHVKKHMKGYYLNDAKYRGRFPTNFTK